jgi:hypothetical protein
MLKLTSQQFARVLETLQKSSNSGGHEKRQFPRFEVQTRLTLATLADKKVGRIYVAFSRDVSCNGVGMLQHAQFAANEKFLVHFPCEKGPMLLICKSLFCRPLAEGIFNVGGAFESEADTDLADQFFKAREAALEAAKGAAAKQA